MGDLTTKAKDSGKPVKTRDINMLSGSLWDKILMFALPLAATSILQQLFNAADMAVIGQFRGPEAMAAVGSNAPIQGLMVNIFVGLSMGANVIVARYIGQGNENRIRDAIHTSILLSIISGIVVAVVGNLAARPMLMLLGVPDEVREMAALYLRIIMTGMPFTMLYNFESAIFRSRGDTKTPLIVLAFSGCLNVALNLFFVLKMGLAVEGIALATVIANGVSAVTLYVIMTRAQEPYRLHLKDLKLHWYILKDVILIGVPAGLQGMVFSISNLVVQSAINSLGPEVMAGSSAAFYLEIFSFFILSSFAQACTSFVSQNYGAGNYARCRRVVRISLVMNVGCTMGLALLLIAFSRPLLSIFTSEPEVIAVGQIRVTTLLLFQGFNCTNEHLSSAMRGLGRSLVPAATSLIGICGTRILWVYTYFQQDPTFQNLLICYPISWIATCMVMTLAYFLVVRKVLPSGGGQKYSSSSK